MKITKKIRSVILQAYGNLDNPASFTSPHKIRENLGLKHIPIKVFERVLSEDPSYVAHRRVVKKFRRKKTVAPGVCI